MKVKSLLCILCLLLTAISCKEDKEDPQPKPPLTDGGIPVVFHVLYEDANDTRQNLPDQIINKSLERLNDFYAAKLYPNAQSTKINVSFGAARYDPTGQKLDRAGIHRVKYNGSKSMACEEFLGMSHPTGSANYDIFWDPDKYINIWLFGFSDKGIAGISYIPYTSSRNPLVGLVVGDTYFFNKPEYMHGIAINNLYLTSFADMEMNVIPHEVGHYLGLLHAFDDQGGCTNSNDMADDYCNDTPIYDRVAYDKSLPLPAGSSSLLSMVRSIVPPGYPLTKAGIDPKYYNRTSCSGQVFRSTNVMDYYFSDLNTLTPQQRDRVEHVLKNSPLIPRIDNTKALQGLEHVDIPDELPIGIMIK